MDEVEKLRTKIRLASFKVQELPIRRGQEIIRWRLIASKHEKSYTVEGESLLGAFQNLGLMLGLRRPGEVLST